MTLPRSSEPFVRTADVKAAVAGREAEVLDALGIDWRQGRPHINCPYPDHADKHPSWRWCAARRRAFCICTASADDVFDITMKLRVCDFAAAKVFVAEVVGLAPHRGPSRRRAPARPTTTPALASPATTADEQRRIAHARELWRRAVPAAGTLVERYLHSRGITIPIPPTIRYLPDAKHAPTSLVLPAMICAVQRLDRRVYGVHRTYLSQDGTRKAGVEQSRMMLGRIAGGAVRLGPVAPKIAVTEGLETALSIVQACPNLSVWAALSTSGMRSLVLPPEVREVILAADADAEGEKAAIAAAARFVEEGREVRIARPATGNDFNDELRGVA